MTEVKDLLPTESVSAGTAISPAALSVEISLLAQRQDELAQAVQRLSASMAEFGQVPAYVEQIGAILADLAKEVAAHDLATVRRRLDDLAETAGEIGALRAEVASVAQAATETTATPAPGQAPTSWWPDLTIGENRAQALECLAVWVDEVLRDRHPELYNQLGACWYLHPDILDELTALRAAWYAAYRDPAAPPEAAIEWHDRWLPGAMRRCRIAIRARGCKGRHEKATPATEPFMDRQDFRNFIRFGPEPAVPACDPAALASDGTPAGTAVAAVSASPAVPAAPPWEPATEPAAEPPLWAATSEPAPPAG
jgi:hypothetical protein